MSFAPHIKEVYNMYLAKRNYDIFDEFFKSPFFSQPSEPATNSRLMKTDVQERKGDYLIDMELPGVAKEDITAELKDGYLTVTAKKSALKSEEDEETKYIRKERFEGVCKRSFYVGEYLNQDDIKAEYKDGILRLLVPKEPEPIPEEPKLISIA